MVPTRILAGPLVGAQPFVVDDPKEFFLDRTDYGHDERDRDGDGLDDVTELEMALYFQPYLSFESTDDECCLNVGEPAVLVRVASPGWDHRGPEPLRRPSLRGA